MDQHYGNGTDHIIKTLGLNWITHVTAEKSYETDQQALRESRKIYEGKYDHDLVIYQAGADIHVDDPLGGLLTTRQMQTRDLDVFLGSLVHTIPLVWNLAGGYAKDKAGTIEPVLALHRQTVQACIRHLQKA